MTNQLPGPRPDARADATVVTALVLAGFGFPMTAAAAAFAFGSLEHIGDGFLVALGVWVLGIGVAFIQPFRPGPVDDSLPPALAWGLAALGVAALAAVMASSAPVLPWSLVLLVGPFFAWIAGSLWILARDREPS